MGRKELIKKITEKKDFSEIANRDVEFALSRFEKKDVSDEEKIRLTRDLLHRVFGAFTSRKLLSPKDKDAEWILRKHLSTRERLEFYGEIYKKLLKGLKSKISVIDFGAGINGFSYSYFEKIGFNVSYTAVESVGQLVCLMNSYFEKNKFDANAIHASLFELDKIKDVLKKNKKPRVVFLFKVIDSLEMMERDYSKKFLLEISKCSERIVLSFATESMVKRRKFRADRKWIINFIEDNFSILGNFEIGSERYIVFEKK